MLRHTNPKHTHTTSNSRPILLPNASPLSAPHHRRAIKTRFALQNRAAKVNRTGNSSLRSNIQYLLDELSAAGPFLTCPWDSTLLGDLEAVATTKYLLAANFRDNADLMPHFIKQVWLLAALLPSNKLFVSIYESGSKKSLTGEKKGQL
jgi:hypothetical protein